MTRADLPAVIAMAQAALERSEAFAERVAKDLTAFGFACDKSDPFCACDVCAASQTLDACREARDRLAGCV